MEASLPFFEFRDANLKIAHVIDHTINFFVDTPQIFEEEEVPGASTMRSSHSAAMPVSIPSTTTLFIILKHARPMNERERPQADQIHNGNKGNNHPPRRISYTVQYPNNRISQNREIDKNDQPLPNRK